MLRYKDQFQWQEKHVAELSKKVETGWDELKGLKQESSDYKIKRAGIEPLRNKFKQASNQK